MATTELVEEQIQITDMVRSLAQAYEEVAVMQMQTVRDSVLSSRDFFYEIAEVYFEVKVSYMQEISKKTKKVAKNAVLSFSTLKKNGKEVVVLIMPNERMTGNIGNLVFAQFIDYVKANTNVDIVVVGITGKSAMEAYNMANPKSPLKFKYIALPKKVNVENLQPVVDYIIEFEHVNVFHGKFINLVRQEATKTNVSGEIEYDKKKKEIETHHYLFEPSLDVILNFFELQIFVYLLLQAFAESDLAKLGSRINAMEVSTKNAEKLKNELILQKRVIQRSIANKKQLQRIAGIALWTQ